MGWIKEEEKHRMLCECRMFAIPSVHEAYGMVAAEAMSYGKPVIASNTGGLPEVVGNAGVLIPPQDEKALAEAINALDGDEARRRQLGNAAKERMNDFSWAAMAKRTGDLYAELVSLR
jgi:glycosyltransferase involved in cell wall biosynthesis